MQLLLLVLFTSYLTLHQVFGESDNQPLTEDPDALLISSLESPANFDLFPVYYEKISQASVPDTTEPTTQTAQSQSRFSSNSRPNPQPFNLILNKNTTNHLNLEDYFGTPEPPTVPRVLQASQLDQLSNIKIKHRSDTSPSAFKTHNKKKIIKKHLSKHRYKKNGYGGSQYLKYPKQAKKPIKIRILSKTDEDSKHWQSQNHHNKRKVPNDWRKTATGISEGGKENEKPIKTLGNDKIYENRSDLVSQLGLGQGNIRSDFLGKLRSLTGGQVVQVTRDKVNRNTEGKAELRRKPNKEIEKNLIKNTKVNDNKGEEKEKIVSQFEAFPLVDQKTPKPSPRRQDRKLQVSSKSQHKNHVGIDKVRTKSSKQIRKGRLNSVGTVDRFRYENADGSITWGYKNEDGSFKEETIGIDCVTHGRFGYVDPAGESREYSYTSGIRCDPDTRKIRKTPEHRSEKAKGYFDYASSKFVMPDGRRVTVRVNQNKRARGKRF